MSQQFNIEIISPDKSIYSSKVVEAVLPCFEGQITILKDHIPLITFLRPGLIELENNKKFYVEDGTVEFSNNNLLILSASAQSLKDIKNQNIESMIKDIWEFQIRLLKVKSPKITSLISHKRFRASYDFLILREQSGVNLNGCGKWWTDVQNQSEHRRKDLSKRQ